MSSLKSAVASSLQAAPIIGVVRTSTVEEAARQAEAFIAGGLELIEITFTVPDAPALIESLRSSYSQNAAPWIGAGTVTTVERARAALDAGARFLVTPNVNPEVADLARNAGVFLAIGALTTTEICAAYELGADIVKVYPLPPVGGPRYLETVRQPLGDIPMLAAGGFGPAEIPAYRKAGAVAFGIGAQLLGDPADQERDMAAALALARGK